MPPPSSAKREMAKALVREHWHLGTSVRDLRNMLLSVGFEVATHYFHQIAHDLGLSRPNGRRRVPQAPTLRPSRAGQDCAPMADDERRTWTRNCSNCGDRHVETSPFLFRCERCRMNARAA